MFYATVANPAQKRTFRALYAQTQATPYAMFIDPNWNKSFDIYPGTIMCRLSGDVVTPYTGAANQKPWGFSEHFMAPLMGIDEITPTANNNFTVWRLSQESEFEVLAPAFDQGATWAQATDGSRPLLAGTSQGLLTPVTGTGTLTTANAIAELYAIPDTTKIQINGNRFA